MKLSEALAGLPQPLIVPRARAEIRGGREGLRRPLVVIDDDPTGTQTVNDVNVYMEWSADLLRRALASDDPVFYVSTNSRGLEREQAETLAYELGHNLFEAANATHTDPLPASRSDSTLRGHFPYEVDALASGMAREFDGVIIVPAFFEGGRYTINDIHYVQQADELVSAEQTEFARDPVFGYRSGNLRLWVEEKTGGAIVADQVRSISLDTIRKRGPEAVAQELLQASSAQPVIVNAACYEDLEVFVFGLLAAEARGKRFIYRCAASFVKVRGGFEDRPLLTRREMAPKDAPGLVVVGSYVTKTSRQLDVLLRSGLAAGIELQVAALLDSQAREAEIGRVSDGLNDHLARGRSAVVYTSRATHSVGEDRFLEAGKKIMSGLCEVVGRIETQPGFLVAKGGITSIEIARSALGAREGFALGQALEGVPVWRLGSEARWSGIPYVVFPGNVGGDDALLNVVTALQPQEEPI